MSFILIIVWVLSVASVVFAAVLLRNFVIVTRRRRELIAALGGSGRAVRSLKHTLMTTYFLFSLFWSVGSLAYFYRLF